MINKLGGIYNGYLHGEQFLAKTHDVVALVARLYVAQVFFMAGLTKIQDWETTLLLFEYEYAVPFISFELAAYLGTIGELVLPVLIVTGLLTRFSAIGLFVVNVVAVISLEEIAPAALYLHYIWGLILLQVTVYGGGKLTVDYAFSKVFNKRNAAMEASS